LFLPQGWESTIVGIAFLIALSVLCGCHAAKRDPNTVVFLIDSSPANLDPRVGTDGQSEHIDELIFDGLVARDRSFHFTPALAERWDQPDPRTIIFHLRGGVIFHDGRPLTSRDVQWTINSMRDGTVITPKAASYASIDSIEAPDARTVIFHLRHPDNFLLTNLSTGAVGIVPEGSGREFWPTRSAQAHFNSSASRSIRTFSSSAIRAVGMHRQSWRVCASLWCRTRSLHRSNFKRVRAT